MAKKKQSPSTLMKNKKAYHEYEILSDFEAGIVLNGDEVKSIKARQVNLKGSFIDIFNEEAFVNEMHVSRYPHSARQEHQPTRKRKILLHKKELIKIEKKLTEQGITAIPLSLYLKKGLIKMRFGLCRGKQLHDKRESLKRKSQDREIEKAIKNASR